MAEPTSPPEHRRWRALMLGFFLIVTLLILTPLWDGLVDGIFVAGKWVQQPIWNSWWLKGAVLVVGWGTSAHYFAEELKWFLRWGHLNPATGAALGVIIVLVSLVSVGAIDLAQIRVMPRIFFAISAVAFAVGLGWQIVTSASAAISDAPQKSIPGPPSPAAPVGPTVAPLGVAATSAAETRTAYPPDELKRRKEEINALRDHLADVIDKTWQSGQDLNGGVESEGSGIFLMKKEPPSKYIELLLDLDRRLARATADWIAILDKYGHADVRQLVGTPPSIAAAINKFENFLYIFDNQPIDVRTKILLQQPRWDFGDALNGLKDWIKATQAKLNATSAEYNKAVVRE